MTLAWHACFAGAYYLLLWRLMEKQAERDALMTKGLLAVALGFFIIAIAMTLMIHASRHGKRTLWFGGFGLLSVVGAKLMLIDLSNKGTVFWTLSLIGIALLVIATSYFSPAPPRNAQISAQPENTDTP